MATSPMVIILKLAEVMNMYVYIYVHMQVCIMRMIKVDTIYGMI